jgi:hypothetical protein
MFKICEKIHFEGNLSYPAFHKAMGLQKGNFFGTEPQMEGSKTIL